LGFVDGAALVLVDFDAEVDFDADVLGSVLESEPQPDSTIARATAAAAAPDIAVRFMKNSCHFVVLLACRGGQLRAVIMP
jgi:hypothetical protein